MSCGVSVPCLFDLGADLLDSEAGISNPEGIKFDIGYDFINATLNGAKR